MRCRRGWPIPTSTFPICCCWSRAAIASCSKCAASAIIAASRRPSTMPRARRSTRPPSCSASRYPGGPAIEELAQSGDPDGRAAAAPAGRLGRAAFLLRRPQERGAARGRLGRSRAARTSPRASSRRWSIASSTAPRVALGKSDAPALVVAGGVAANQAIRAALADLADARTAARFSVPPAWLCTDNAAMIAWAGAERFAAGPDRPARRSGARALAARRERREGARRGGEGMKLGGRSAAAPGAPRWRRSPRPAARETLLWALEAEVVEAINAATRTRVFLAGVPLDPAIRATSRPRRSRQLRCLAGGHPGPAYARGARTRAPTATSRWSSAPRASRRRSGELLHDVAREACPTRRSRCCPGRPSRMRSPTGLPTAVTLAAEDRALAERLRERIAQPTFRIYLSDDVAGAEIGGAVKNVLAIACGVVEGKGLGQNARAALIAPRLCRDDPLRPRLRRAARDARRPVGPRRPGADLLVDQLAQLFARARASARAAPPPSCWLTAGPSPRAPSPRRCLPGWRARRASTCRSSRRSTR